MNAKLSALFLRWDAAGDALSELRRHGVPDHQLSVLAWALPPEAYPAGAYFPPLANGGGVRSEAWLWGLPVGPLPGPFLVAGGPSASLREALGPAPKPSELPQALRRCGWSDEEAQAHSEALAQGGLLLVLHHEGLSALDASRWRGILGRHGGRLPARGLSLLPPTASSPDAQACG